MCVCILSDRQHTNAHTESTPPIRHAHILPHRHTHPYLPHEVGEEEHVAEEGGPAQQVTDAEAAVLTGHGDHGLEQRLEGHPLLDLPHTHTGHTK